MGGQSYFPGMERREPMHALTVCQPWAWAIARGFKRVENRSWATNFRGPLAIHAGLSRKWIDGGRTHLYEAARDYDRPDWRMPDEDALVYGAIVAVASVVECVTIDELLRRDEHDLRGAGPGLPAEILAFAGGPWCWLLEDVRPLAEPIPCRGAQGLWTPPVDVRLETRDVRLEA